ncbi:MAG: diguanylate cyclase (GGDEF)-like protein [Bermanella sp.]
MTTLFKINVCIQDVPLCTQVINWVNDCSGLQPAKKEQKADLYLWDTRTFLYEQQLGRSLPKAVIVMAGGDQTLEKQILLSGALDFIGPSVDFNILALRLSKHVQQLQYLNRLESLSVTDTLTGLFNRRKFDEQMDICWRQSIRDQLTCSMLMLDVDHFKVFNDTYGHLTGDLCLQDLSKAFQLEAVRPHDTVARVGGEEFAIILPDTNPRGAEHVAHKIIQRVTGLNILNEHTSLGVVSVSVGLACATPKTGDMIDVWRQEADEALYFAKESGRNQVKTDKSSQDLQESLIF